MTDRPTQPLPPPVDPWAGTAPVLPAIIQPEPYVPEPYVIVVERRRKRRWPWVLGGFVLFCGLCCTVALALVAPISKEYPAHLELGDQVAGLSRVDDPKLNQAADELARQVRNDQGVNDAVAGLFIDPRAEGRLVIIIGATKLILNPAAELDAAIQHAANRLRDLTAYPQLGGHLKCANSEDDEGQPVVVCAWIDHGSLGLAIFYGSWTMDDCAVRLHDIRTAIVRRGN